MARDESRRGPGEGALYFDATKGRWVGRVVVDGQRRKVLATTKTEARERLKALRSSADKGLPVTPGDITLGQLLVAWEAKGLPNRDLSPSQRMAHRWAISILTEDLGRRRLRTLSPDHVEAAFARRALGVERTSKTSGRGRVAGGPLSRGSLIKLRSTLNQALAWAQRRDLIARNIAPLVELPPGARPPTPGRSMTVEQAMAFLAAARGTDLEAMWVTMLYLGLRPGEAAAIAWADIDADAGVIHIWRAQRSTPSAPLLLARRRRLAASEASMFHPWYSKCSPSTAGSRTGSV